MAVKRFLIYGLLAFLVNGCGQKVTETLHVPESSLAQTECLTDKSVVVLPFADYSLSDDVASAWQRNLVVVENLIDQLNAKGFTMPVQEDVFDYLTANKVISPIPLGKNLQGNTSLEYEINDQNWSDSMKSIITGIIVDEEKQSLARKDKDDPLTAPGTHGLDRKMVKAIGKDFNADYLVRGRIIKYNLQQGHSWEPGRLGLLPFVVNGMSKTMFGFAKSEEYDNLDALAVTALAGALIGSNVETPFEPQNITSTLDATGTNIITTTTGTENAANWNGFVWGAGAATAAHLAKNSGDIPEAVVQLRVWIQDSSTGEVVWTNRAEVKVAPESVFGDKRSTEIFNTAVNKAVGLLIDDFWSKNKARI